MIKHWRDEAACNTSTDPDVFYREDEFSQRAAKQVCFSCPVRRKCLSDALVNDEEFGILGGMTREERVGYLPHFRHTTPDLPEVIAAYRRPRTSGRGADILEQRLVLAKQLKASLRSDNPNYDSYRALLDAAIMNPQTPFDRIAGMIHRSESWVDYAWMDMKATVA